MQLELDCDPVSDSFSRYRLFFFIPEPASGELLVLGIAALAATCRAQPLQRLVRFTAPTLE